MNDVSFTVRIIVTVLIGYDPYEFFYGIDLLYGKRFIENEIF